MSTDTHGEQRAERSGQPADAAHHGGEAHAHHHGAEGSAHGHEHAAGHEHRDGSLNRLAVSATTHCLTGCAAGEVTGMAIATALGWSNFGQIGLAVGLAFLFGYTLTSIPLFRAGLTFAAALPIILATDTVSIAIMEVVDNAVVLLVPGAMEASVTDPLLWGSVALGFAVAFPFAWWANRYLLARGKGHALVHQYHHH
jgi:Domain of unknown function (DUF4396)